MILVKKPFVFLALVFLASAAFGCGTEEPQNTPDMVISTGDTADSSDIDTSRVPEHHRETAEACDQVREPGVNKGPGEPEPESLCANDAECTAGDNGRCTDMRFGAECTYDTCFTDDDCGAKGVCVCGGDSAGNRCESGNCRTDQDCGEFHCSPTLGTCGYYDGTVGYYCHTAEDECVNDSDCSQESAGYCMYSGSVGHWICGYDHCVG